VGAGYTGLAAAIELAVNGVSVTVLDAHRVGWGASGRNGGQLGTGFNMKQGVLEQKLGKPAAQALWKIAEDAKQTVHSLCKAHHLNVEYRPGIVYAQHRARTVKPVHEYCRRLTTNYGYSQMQLLDKQDIRELVASDNYYGGALDTGAGHLHPLKLATGLAQAAEGSGVKIHELSEVIRIDRCSGSSRRRVVTPSGSVTAEHVILAGNGYLDRISSKVEQRVMPINNFIIVTEPLGLLAEELLPFDHAVADSRFVVNYFRRVAGDRLLFGGGENYSYKFPDAIDWSVRRAMLGVFPMLRNARIDYAWGGTLAITRSRLPYITQLAPGLLNASGYSGHGVALAILAGTALGEKLCGIPDRFEQLTTLPTQPFPGGITVRPALLAMAMAAYSWLDRL
jgi:gamma-glutamylputrescine oxidase